MLGAVLFLHVPTATSYAKEMTRLNNPDIQGVTSTARRKQIGLRAMADAVLEIASFCSKDQGRR
jgi:hypothetical protein